MRQFQMIIILLGLSVIFSACRKNEYEPEPEDIGHSYFPLKKGHTWIYEVDSVVYNSFNPQKLKDTFSYLVRHRIEDVYMLAGPDSTYDVLRYLSKDTGRSWQFDRSIQLQRNASNAQRVSSGLRTIPLAFPILLNKTWDGNLYNNLEPQEYLYLETDRAYALNDSTEVSSVKVLQQDRENLVQRYYAEELYGKHIGLLERRYISLENVYDSTKTNGVDYHYRLLEFVPAP